MTAIRKFCQGALVMVMLAALPLTANAFIYGSDKTGNPNPVFNLTADSNFVQDQNTTAIAGVPNILVWTFNDYETTNRSTAQYPSIPLIVDEGSVVTVNLTNNLNQPVSFTIPAFAVTAVDAAGNPVHIAYPKGNRALLSSQFVETAPGATVTYKFTASAPGTYIYQSGTNMAIQLPMGLSGALIVRPASAAVTYTIPATLASPASVGVTTQGNGDVNTISGSTVTYHLNAYDPLNGTDDSTAYDREFIYIMTEQDPALNVWMQTVPKPTPVLYDLTTWNPNTWLVNGRDGIDTFLNPNVPYGPFAGTSSLLQPNIADQPYSSLPVCHPGERLLLRLVNLGHDPHPIHQHGSNFRTVAINGKQLSSGAGSVSADRAFLANTSFMKPGETRDVIWTWEDSGLGWDAYNHASSAPGTAAPYENLSNHGKKFATVAETTHTVPLRTGVQPLSNTLVIDSAITPANYSTQHGSPLVTPTVGADVANPIANINTGSLPVLLPASPWITNGMTGGFWSSPFFGVAPGTLAAPTQFATNAFAGGSYPHESINNAAPAPQGNPSVKNPTAVANADTNITTPVDPTNVNTNNSFFFMWHSHAERELTSLGLFPGGMLSMMELRPWSVPISEFDQ
jgi:FtsP/CotA-like multicopper oxidase with cupredoxin domain